MRALSLKNRDYVVTDERKLPTKQQTVFKLKTLSAREIAELEDILYSRETVVRDEGAVISEALTRKTGTYSLRALQMGLIGWENFLGHQDKPIPFDLKEHLDSIPRKYRDELATEILVGSSLTMEKSTAKN